MNSIHLEGVVMVHTPIKPKLGTFISVQHRLSGAERRRGGGGGPELNYDRCLTKIVTDEWGFKQLPCLVCSPYGLLITLQ